MPSLLAATNEDQASLLATVIAKNNQGAQTNQNLQTAGNSAPTAPVAA